MSKERESLALPADSMVGRYQLRRVERSWGFSLTYLAEVKGTTQRVLVHELLPEELVERAANGTVQAKSERAAANLVSALECFTSEGRSLAGCAHPGMQKVLEVLEANGTAYWITPRDEERNLRSWLKELGRPPTEGELRTLLRPLLAALRQLHDAGLYHLNLKFETIQMTPRGKPVLVHFAGSRQAIARSSHAASAVTPGYSPIEQYGDVETEGPWTDIYSLAAVLHRAIAGRVPPEATSRLTNDPYQKLAVEYFGKYQPRFLRAIDAALETKATARPQSITEWRKMLGMPGGKATFSRVRRNPALLSAGAALVAGLLGVGIWYLSHVWPAPAFAGKVPDRKKPVAREDHRDQEKTAKEDLAAEEKDKDAQKSVEEDKKVDQPKPAEDRKDAAAEVKAPEIKPAEEKPAQETVEAKDEAKTPPGQSSPQPAAPAGSGGLVGSSLGGVWETAQKNANGLPLKTLIIYPDARYELSGDASDTGIIKATLGVVCMNSDKMNGTAVFSTFKYKSMVLLETDGALGKLEWVRVSPGTPERAQNQSK